MIGADELPAVWVLAARPPRVPPVRCRVREARPAREGRPGAAGELLPRPPVLVARHPAPRGLRGRRDRPRAEVEPAAGPRPRLGLPRGTSRATGESATRARSRALVVPVAPRIVARAAGRPAAHRRGAGRPPSRAGRRRDDVARRPGPAPRRRAVEALDPGGFSGTKTSSYRHLRTSFGGVVESYSRSSLS